MTYHFWRRGWWFEASHRWQTVLAFLSIALASSLGVGMVNRNSEEDIARLCAELQEDRVDFRAFVSDLMESASPAERVRVFSRLDERAPEERVCGGRVVIPNPAPPLPTTTTAAPK